MASIFKSLALSLALWLPLVAARAAADDSKGGVVYEKKTVINFEDDTIQGDLTRPDGEYVEARKKVTHSNLIRVREEFRQKVLKSAGQL
ncbi:MAG: adventurous gliding motility protein CglF [Deltaproteobacteria bacterium]